MICAVHLCKNIFRKRWQKIPVRFCEMTTKYHLSRASKRARRDNWPQKVTTGELKASQSEAANEEGEVAVISSYSFSIFLNQPVTEVYYLDSKSETRLLLHISNALFEYNIILKTY